MSIELTTASQAELNGILGTISPPVLSSLPTTDAAKAGEMFWYNGTLWTYAKTEQFGTLVEGTPWPVKGYKEFICEVNSGTAGFISIIQNDVFDTLPTLDNRFGVERSFSIAGVNGVAVGHGLNSSSIEESGDFAVLAVLIEDNTVRLRHTFGLGRSAVYSIRIYPPTS